MLQALDDRIGWGFDLLERDHEALDALIHDLATGTNGVLAAVRAGEGADAAAARSRDGSRRSGGSSTGTWSTRRSWSSR